MTAPERIWIDAWGGNWSPQAGGTQGVEYVRADLAAVQPAQVRDLISRMDAIQACQVGPSDEWAKATKSGYDQAATDCQRNILRIKPAALEPQPDPRDEVIARLLEALESIADPDRVASYGDPVVLRDAARAALAAAKAAQK